MIKNHPSLKKALAHLQDSLEGLERAVTQQREQAKQSDSYTKQIENRMGRLEQANKEVSYRLIKAMETIRTVLDKNQAPSHADH